ncbi:contactin-associated protein-like 4 [Clinocottus analis]|uniref:contactin-associated protein-like 4 n=1 Tax=Clinocottus analis TaxID=304258 RepID=UPI0035C124BE
MDLWSNKVWGFILQVALMLLSSYGPTAGDACHSPLVPNLPPSSFRSSSQLSGSHGPGYAKLNRREGAGGWSPQSSDRYQWLEVDLGVRTHIAAVATQGRYGSSDWLTAYLLMFSDAGHNWKQYRQEEGIEAFPGNTNADSVVQHKLQHPVVARYVRLVPLDWNANGRIGLRLETYGCPYNSDVLGLDGGSSLLFRLSPGPRQSVSLAFKALRSSGTLLHASGPSEQSLVLQLERGELLLLLRKGRTSSPDSQRSVSLGRLFDDQHWHRVGVERRGGHLNLTVDRSTQRVPVPPGLAHWDHDQMSVGADPGLGSRRSLGSNAHFHGCLENLVYNGVNLVELAKENDPRVSVKGNVTFSCAEPVFVAMTFASPQSFLRLPRPTDGTAAAASGASVGLQFRTWNKAGLLLTFDLPQQEGAVWLYLSRARLHLQIHKKGRAPLELHAGSDLSDGQWHAVELLSRRGRLSVSVDGGEGAAAHASPPFLITTGGHLYFGGCPADGGGPECMNPFKAFQGCMRLLTVHNRPVDLIPVQQRLLGNYSHLQIDMCGITDRCSQSHCEHGGSCSQSWSSFHCNCSGTGYSGATCHSSVYEQSCEAYKHRGNTSGFYHVDVDGSGPVRPQLMFCDMTEDRTWTVIQHNNTELTRVGPGGRSRHSAHFLYASEDEQLEAVVGQSEHCEQELTYHCRKSRLLNTPDGPLLSWWVGGPGAGQVQTFWGGAPPGSQLCSCGLQQSCVDNRHACNCDADRPEWANDSGLLTHKETLPVRSLVLGDVQRPGSESAYRVGPLRCHGDRNVWNAAFFDKETSYLHFPTFQGELSADVSFLFKTSSSSGVFLENLGIRDFIRIELASSWEVVFSFDVGNGPLEVRVASASPLSDGRWHRVRAERNVKEASLQLDERPAATRAAPAAGHTHLQLNSQLFIGGTASRQKGFRGCIRSLQLNGVTLDLAGRAGVTPGVAPGCPGHCSSYGSLCRNRGRCLERPRSFACDCSRSASTGAFCDREVSASFKSGTSVSYTFREPAVAELNRSSGDGTGSSDLNPRAENVSLSFRTGQSPALLLYVGSQSSEYLVLLLNKHDMLEVRYRLDSSKDADILRSGVRNLANGQLHAVVVSRRADAVSLQIDQNTKEDFNLTSDVEFSDVRSLVLGRLHDSGGLDPELSRLASLGYTGCLSGVLFNSVSPLKAALLHPDTSPVVVTGPLVPSVCGSTSANPHAAEATHHLSGQSGSVGRGHPVVNAMRSDSAVIGGVIAAVIFVGVSALAVAARVLYRRKGACRRQEVKAAPPEESPESPPPAAFSRQTGPSENQREYFI